MSPGSFSYREGKRRSLIGNLVSALVVAVVLVINPHLGDALASLVFALIIALDLYGLWVKHGQPRGIASAEAEE